jgi:hypothetical protein
MQSISWVYRVHLFPAHMSHSLIPDYFGGFLLHVSQTERPELRSSGTFFLAPSPYVLHVFWQSKYLFYTWMTLLIIRWTDDTVLITYDIQYSVGWDVKKYHNSCVGKDLEGDNSGLFQGTFSALTLIDEDNHV